jgi:hypothetical protein
MTGAGGAGMLAAMTALFVFLLCLAVLACCRTFRTILGGAILLVLLLVLAS